MRPVVEKCLQRSFDVIGAKLSKTFSGRNQVANIPSIWRGRSGWLSEGVDFPIKTRTTNNRSRVIFSDLPKCEKNGSTHGGEALVHLESRNS